MSGRVTAIDVAMKPYEKIFIGTASGGVWTSEGGAKWTPIFDKQPTQSIGALAINQANPSEIWVGTGEGNPRNSHNSGMGIFKSIDGGVTWKHMGLKKTKTIHRIRINPQNPKEVYVAALGSAWGENKERGVFKTTDGGETWKKVLYLNQGTGCAELVMDPHNPNKLIAAIWEFGRKPWTFNSGGKNSGLHITHDGGKTWKQLTEKDGLPKGNLGRIGLAIAPSQPNIVYALIEAKENAVYKSTDGGLKWKQISKDKTAGNRPFYYSEIYVDPNNENRIYSLWTNVSRSEDGGKTWQNLLAYKGFGGVHPDHHAMWIHPQNPNYIINGNDGGLNISRDKGKTWEFVDNLPLAQFYHINYDMSIPYRIGGGMQDNGSWVGPSWAWQRGGIVNSSWKEVAFGDGFDVVFEPNKPSHCYAMSQNGWVSYINMETGKSRTIRPVHPDSIELRFNWNAAIAQDPFDSKTVYFGSQFVHKSTENGLNWEIISPDLTNTDTVKQKASRTSGGLTPDVTAAENFNSILAIEPSSLDKNVIWVSTDDGNIQITRNRGDTWTNVASRLPGVPKGAWIPQINASIYEAGEALVVVNDYRRNNWRPYAYHTSNYGQTWTRIVSERQVDGHVWSIVQDPVEKDLLFLGTDYGLYVSIDFGQNWSKWEEFPSTSVADLKIHPREGDLIIGTFGRAAWVLDDIRPLREMAKSNGKVLNKELHVFETPDAYQTNYRSVDGTRFGADGYFMGENRKTGAMITIYGGKAKPKKEKDDHKAEEKKADKTKDKKKKTSKPKVYVMDFEGDTIRTFTTKIDTGFTRIYWNMRMDGTPFPSRKEPKEDADLPSGNLVLPGIYKLVFVKNDSLKDSTTVKVHTDPRLEISLAQINKENAARDEVYAFAKNGSEQIARLRKAQKTITLIDSWMENAADSTKTKITDQGKELKKSIGKLMDEFTGLENQKGYFKQPVHFNELLWRSLSRASSADGLADATVEYEKLKLNRFAERLFNKVDKFFEEDWKTYRTEVESLKVSLFEE